MSSSSSNGFYPCNWARYDLAVPGSFKLLPAQQSQIAELERDYRGMQVMLFGNVPAFSAILIQLRQLEGQINSLQTNRESRTRTAGGER